MSELTLEMPGGYKPGLSIPKTACPMNDKNWTICIKVKYLQQAKPSLSSDWCRLRFGPSGGPILSFRNVRDHQQAAALTCPRRGTSASSAHLWAKLQTVGNKCT